MIKMLISFLGLLLIPLTSLSDTFYSQGSGAFDQTFLWNTIRDGNGIDPKNGDFNNGNHRWVIQQGDSINVAGKWRNITVIVEGYLKLEPGQDFQPGDSLIINEGATLDYNYEEVDLLNTTLVSEGDQINKVNVLPVELSHFNAYKSGLKVYIEWETQTERENYGFYILRDGEKIGFLKGQGNSTQKTSYVFEDSPSFKERHFYHLLQEDYDGSKKLYGPKKIKGVVSVLVKGERGAFKVTIKDKPGAKVVIHNTLGKKVYTFYVNGSYYETYLNRKDLSFGIYTLTVFHEGYKETILFNMW